LTGAAHPNNAGNIKPTKDMSGGAYNYAYYKIEELAGDISRNAKTPERKAFVRLLVKVAKAAKAIEWNDSGDGDPHETDLIREALGEGWKKICLQELVHEADVLIRLMQDYIANERGK
jgi:hypothetical protein